jgi:hypothetical protein
MLKSVYLVSYGSKVTGERLYHNKNCAISSMEVSGILDGLGRIPCFYNGVQLRSRKALIEALKAETGKRLVTKIQWCNDENQGFERALAIQTFASVAAFERSVYCRKWGSYRQHQIEAFENLIK